METRFFKLLPLFVVVAALSACGSRVRLADQPTTSTTTAQPQTQGGNGNGGATSDGTATRNPTPTGQSGNGNAVPTAGVPNESVYFDFDSSVVKEQYNGLISRYGNFLKANRTKVRLEGNTDERGDSEYNLALGARRAESVRKALGSLGLPDSQLETVSYGKERPRASGHDEESWAQNRRVDFHLLP